KRVWFYTNGMFMKLPGDSAKDLLQKGDVSGRVGDTDLRGLTFTSHPDRETDQARLDGEIDRIRTSIKERTMELTQLEGGDTRRVAGFQLKGMRAAAGKAEGVEEDGTFRVLWGWAGRGCRLLRRRMLVGLVGRTVKQASVGPKTHTDQRKTSGHLARLMPHCRGPYMKNSETCDQFNVDKICTSIHKCANEVGKEMGPFMAAKMYEESMADELSKQFDVTT
ncbi:hypothetical protein BDK51DRAFT_28679, partial [Blyttiomyces helicus]